MSEHLDQPSIYAYLDRELPQAELAALEDHLSSCAECRQRVALAERLFAEIGRLPEELLAVDLAAGVLERLAPRTGWLPRLAFGELLAALAVGVGLWLGLGSATVSARLLGARAQLAGGLEAAWQAALTAAARSVPDPASIRLELGAPAIWMIAGAALLLWALGNGLVLRRVAQGSGR